MEPLLEDINSYSISTSVDLRSKGHDWFPFLELNNTAGFGGFGFILPPGHHGQQ